MNGSPTQNHMLLNVDRSVAEIQHNIHRVSDLIHSTGASVNEVSTLLAVYVSALRSSFLVDPHHRTLPLSRSCSERSRS
jgi:hypothetical protein